MRKKVVKGRVKRGKAKEKEKNGMEKILAEGRGKICKSILLTLLLKDHLEVRGDDNCQLRKRMRSAATVLKGILANFMLKFRQSILLIIYCNLNIVFCGK